MSKPSLLDLSPQDIRNSMYSGDAGRLKSLAKLGFAAVVDGHVYDVWVVRKECFVHLNRAR